MRLFALGSSWSSARGYRATTSPYNARGQADAFVADWGEDMLGPLAEAFLATEDGEGSGSGMDQEGLATSWPRLLQIREGLLDVEGSRTKVELARQRVVDRYDPESVAHALTKVGLARWQTGKAE